MKRIFEWIVLCAAIVTLAVAAYNIIKIETEYNTAVDEYRDLSQYVKEVGTDTASASASVSTDSQSDSEEDHFWYPKLDIDFASLEAQNENFVGWLLMDSVGISYPVAQSDDNEYYLHHTFEGKANSSGCVFLDFVNKSDLTDHNSFIYGHNMKNGSMFGSLKKLRDDDSGEIYNSDPYFYIYTKDNVYKYKIYSYYVTPPDSDTYNYVNTEEQYSKYQDMILGFSQRDCGVKVSTDRPTVTLSTCSGSGATKKRFVVHGIQIGKCEEPVYE